MSLLMRKMFVGLFASLCLAQPVMAVDVLDENTETVSAGSKKLTEEEHQLLKEERFEKLENGEEDERGSLQTNGMYLTTHPMASHGIIKVSPYYDRVVLNDGSVWEVCYDRDRSILSRWSSWNDQVTISPAGYFDPTDYVLVSQRTGETVCVSLVEMEVVVGDPYYNGQRLWISTMDYLYDYGCGCYFYQILLSDGSVWEVSTRDSARCSYMFPGDVVFVGVDEGVFAPTHNILIHFNSLEYVHADCVTR